MGLSVWYVYERSTQDGPGAAPTSKDERNSGSQPSEGERREFKNRWAVMQAAYNTPIEFYGKVVDQYGDPVEGANVHFYANDKYGDQHSSEYNRVSDADGKFEITGVVGMTISVDVQKTGYWQVPENQGKQCSNGYFEYFHLSDDSLPLPKKDKPAVFVLQKPGVLEPLVHMKESRVIISRDGAPLTIRLDGDNGSHAIELRCWNKERQMPLVNGKYDWDFELRVPGGGLVKRTNTLGFEAPEGGYDEADAVHMLATMPYRVWKDSASMSYFFRFSDGTFGRADLTMYALGKHLVVWESYYNPKPSSRFLEAEPPKPKNYKSGQR